MKRLAILVSCAAMLTATVPMFASATVARSAGLPAFQLIDCEVFRGTARPYVYQGCIALLKALTPVGTVVATGTIDASSPTGTVAKLPFPASYRIDVAGTWTNTGSNWLDAEYSGTATGYRDGWEGLGADFGDTQIDGTFVNWGAFNPAHGYSYTGSYSRSVALGVFVGVSGTKMPAWYADNSGSLSYTIRYVG